MTFLRSDPTSDVTITGTVPVEGDASSNVPVYTSNRTGVAVTGDRLLYQRFRNNAGGANAVLFSLNTSSAATFSVGSTADCVITRVIFQMEDGTMNVDDFGGISNGIVADYGVLITVHDKSSNAQILDFLDASEITLNRDFSILGATDVLIRTGTPNDVMTVRWTIEKSGKALYLPSNHSLCISVRTDLTPLVNFTAKAHGWYP